MLRRWARRGALPLVGQMLSGVDPKFKGVRAVGATLKALHDRGRLDVTRLTEKSQRYEKLGVTGLRAAFQENHAASFTRIAAERRRLMKASPVYKAMCNKKSGAAGTGDR